jgi:hypothetical protein
LLTAEDYERALRLEQELLAARNAITAWQPWFDAVGKRMARINERQIFEVRQLLFWSQQP